jgi:hypothetical protein
MKKQLVVGLSVILLASAGAISSVSAQEQTQTGSSVSQADGLQQQTNDAKVAQAVPSNPAKTHFSQRSNRYQETDGSKCVGPISFCDIYFGS